MVTTRPAQTTTTALLASGYATIPVDAIYVDVPHGLGSTPNINKIVTKARQDMGGTGNTWVSSVDATNFRIQRSTNADLMAALEVSYNIFA